MSSERIGLRGRLALSIAAIVVVAFGVSFYAVYKITGAQLRSRIDKDLRAASDALAKPLRAAPSEPSGAARSVRRYFGAQPFGPSARLLIVTIPGAGTISNEPELVGSEAETRERAGDPSEEQDEATELKTAPSGFSEIRLEDAGKVRVLTRTVRTAAGPATIRTGEPLQSVDRAQSEVAQTFLVVGALTLAAALLAGYLVAARTAAPLRRMARIAAVVDGGDLSHRIRSSGPHDEIRLLAESFDHMLDRLEEAFSKQREFVSDASHELRTPLTAIRGQLEVLSRERQPSAQRIEEVEEHTMREIARMQRLIDDLLMLARLDEGLRPAPADVPVDALLEELAATSADDRELDFAGAPHGTLRGDPDQLAQVVRNLLRNAVDHTAPDGRVRLGAASVGDGLRVFVDDDGVGIPEAEQARVFDRFHRLEAARDRRSGGSGLGLAIAKSIVEAHGGRIWAETSPLGGARIAFELPRFTPAADSDTE